MAGVTTTVKITGKQAEELCRLLGNGEDIPGAQLRWARIQGETVFIVSDLVHFLTKLAENAVSDQKQEAFRGLRDYLVIMAKE